MSVVQLQMSFVGGVAPFITGPTNSINGDWCGMNQNSGATQRLADFTNKKRKADIDLCPEELLKENRSQCPLSQTPLPAPRQRRFLQLAASSHLYQTEDWKPKQESLFQPVEGDLMVNMINIEQISFAAGSFFVADREGSYCGSHTGHVVHLWRFSETDRKLYISRSFLITDPQLLQMIKTQLSEV